MPVSTQSYNVARGGRINAKSTAGGVCRLIFVNPTGYNYN